MFVNEIAQCAHHLSAGSGIPRMQADDDDVPTNREKESGRSQVGRFSFKLKQVGHLFYVPACLCVRVRIVCHCWLKLAGMSHKRAWQELKRQRNLHGDSLKELSAAAAST